MSSVAIPHRTSEGIQWQAGLQLQMICHGGGCLAVSRRWAVPWTEEWGSRDSQHKIVAFVGLYKEFEVTIVRRKEETRAVLYCVLTGNKACNILDLEMDGWMDGRMDGRIDRGKFCFVFYACFACTCTARSDNMIHSEGTSTHYFQFCQNTIYSPQETLPLISGM